MNAKTLKTGSVRQCPECGGNSTVINSRDGSGRLRRRRKCLKCGERWTTVEMLERESMAMPRVAQRAIGEAWDSLNVASRMVEQARRVVAALEAPERD